MTATPLQNRFSQASQWAFDQHANSARWCGQEPRSGPCSARRIALGSEPHPHAERRVEGLAGHNPILAIRGGVVFFIGQVLNEQACLDVLRQLVGGAQVETHVVGSFGSDSPGAKPLERADTG